MWFIILLALSLADDCDSSLNDDDYVNPDCNWAGLCFNPGSGDQCYCCNSKSDQDFCQGRIPGVWAGKTCDQATYYVSLKWAYLLEGSELSCPNDGLTASTPDLLNQTSELVSDEYGGLIVSQPCKICTPDDPCEFFEMSPVADSGIMVMLATDINTYYDHGCEYITIPQSVRRCDENWDNGAEGHTKIYDALDGENDYQQFYTDLQSLISSNGDNGLSMSNTTITRVWHEDVQILQSNVQTTRLPTPAPTPEPIEMPTANPIAPPQRNSTGLCKEYVNSVNDLQFMGVGSSCRANIDVNWTGGQTCESPYVVCLPEENTPTDDMMGNPYKSTDYRYTVDECLLECSYDQRCLGVEFVADEDSATGDCNLIDDIPVAIENEVFGYIYNSADTDLDSSTTGGVSLCWAKANYCNPYFEAEDLNDVMLNCYCPNNRKGFYTKKVQRTVNNTRYCGSDEEADERIRKAQANRMFHLCENWCLFETENPQRESFYWDPWKKCWRETYSGTGVHRSYCDRVIRNPDSIEMKFLNYRSDNFHSCGVSLSPSSAPIADSYVWVLSEVEDSCDDACLSQNYTCAEEATAQYMTRSELKTAFSEAGITCADQYTSLTNSNYDGFALPGYRSSKFCVGRQATLSHLENLDTDCSREIGAGWQRLCACYQ